MIPVVRIFVAERRRREMRGRWSSATGSKCCWRTERRNGLLYGMPFVDRRIRHGWIIVVDDGPGGSPPISHPEERAKDLHLGKTIMAIPTNMPQSRPVLVQMGENNLHFRQTTFCFFPLPHFFSSFVLARQDLPSPWLTSIWLVRFCV